MNQMVHPARVGERSGQPRRRCGGQVWVLAGLYAVAMSSERDGVEDPKRKMLDRAVELMSHEGSGGWTLRRLAERLDTSHRMIIYHFGSLEGLLVEVVKSVEEEQQRRRERLKSEGLDLRTSARALRDALLDPDLAAHERLFFELYAAGLQGHEYALPLLESSVSGWLDGIRRDFEAATRDRSHAEADARLGLAVMRGLLLDYLATGDRAAVVEAHERYLSLYAHLVD